ncbi:putative Ig domain-containing protein, partial [Tropheryma whipplei]
ASYASMPGTNHIPYFVWLNGSGGLQGTVAPNVEPGEYRFPVIVDGDPLYYLARVVP